jgi:hypothetical protein
MSDWKEEDAPWLPANQTPCAGCGSEETRRHYFGPLMMEPAGWYCQSCYVVAYQAAFPGRHTEARLVGNVLFGGSQ